MRKVACRWQALTTDFLDAADGADLVAASRNGKIEMTEAWLETWYDRLDVPALCEAHYLSEGFVERHIADVDWGALSMNKLDMTEPFLVRHKRRVHWRPIAVQYFLDESFVRRYADAPHVKADDNYLPLDAVLEAQELSEAFLSEFVLTHPEHVRALMLVATQYQRLSERFIEAHIRSGTTLGDLGDVPAAVPAVPAVPVPGDTSDVLNWDYVSMYQPISASFVDRHVDDLNWFNVSMARALPLGDAFMLKHVDRLYFDQINSLKAMELVAWKKAPLEQEALLRAVYDGVVFAEHDDESGDDRVRRPIGPVDPVFGRPVVFVESGSDSDWSGN